LDTRTVLIVEDDPDTQFIYERFLSHHGFHVVLGVTGEEGVRLARHERPDVILMDISIPGIDGWEASRRIKSDPLTAEIPIIVVTAHAFPEDRARAEALGCARFLTKPCDPVHILETIRESMNGSGDEPSRTAARS
jgi:two-component system, cell cycle response regulator DivK